MQDITRSSLELLYNISRELASTLDLRTVLSRVLFLSVRNVGAERGTLIVLDAQGKPVEAAIVVGDQLIPQSTQHLQGTLDQGLAGWVLRSRQISMVPDTSKDSRWLRRPDDAVEKSGAKSAICVPLQSRDEAVGVLTIVHPLPGFFNQDHLDLLQAIADQAGIAVYNARLYESLETATRRYRELFEDSIDPILITDQEGKVLEGNRQALQTTGFSRDVLSSKNVSDLHTIQWNTFGNLRDIFENERTVSYESILHREDGEKLPIQVYVRKVIIGGEPYLQWILRDLTERKKLDALQDDMIAMIYHDLRSPLANIVSSIDMLEILIPPDSIPSIHTVIAIAKRSTDRLHRLINSLLDINRLESGQTLSNQKSTPLQELVTDAVEGVSPMAESKHLKVVVDTPENIPNLWVDADMIKRVLINLLENGVKFTPVYGQLTVGAKVEEEFARLWVQDTGPGIAQDAQERIFNKFVRLQSGPAYPKGIGLGLAFCRLAVTAHGGKIWVESQPGEGSCFQFTVPLAREE